MPPSLEDLTVIALRLCVEGCSAMPIPLLPISDATAAFVEKGYILTTSSVEGHFDVRDVHTFAVLRSLPFSAMSFARDESENDRASTYFTQQPLLLYGRRYFGIVEDGTMLHLHHHFADPHRRSAILTLDLGTHSVAWVADICQLPGREDTLYIACFHTNSIIELFVDPSLCTARVKKQVEDDAHGACVDSAF